MLFQNENTNSSLRFPLSILPFYLSFSSGGDDGEPNIVVLKMQKPDNKSNRELWDPVLTKGITQGSGESGKSGSNPGHVTHNAGSSGSANTGNSKKATTGGKCQKQTSFALVARDEECHKVKRHAICPKGTDLPTETFPKSLFQDARFLDLDKNTGRNSIPISGYSTFQQIDFSQSYFDFCKYFHEVKSQADERRNQPTRICQGSMSKGPFPFYEEIPLIRILIASLIEKSCDDYIPTANTNTNLPLIVSP